jgi:hypothetical protein
MKAAELEQRQGEEKEKNTRRMAEMLLMTGGAVDPRSGDFLDQLSAWAQLQEGLKAEKEAEKFENGGAGRVAAKAAKPEKPEPEIDVLDAVHATAKDLGISLSDGKLSDEQKNAMMENLRKLEKTGKLTKKQRAALEFLSLEAGSAEGEANGGKDSNGSGWIAPAAITAGGAAGTAGLLYKLGALNKTTQAAANPTSGVLSKIAQKVAPSSSVLAKLAPVVKGVGVAGTLVGAYPFAKDIVQGSTPEKVGGALGVGGTLLGGGAAVAAPSALTIGAPILPVVGGALLKHNVESDLQDRPSDAIDQVQAYATGAQTVWPNTATQVMGAIFGPEGGILDREYTQRIVDQRIDQIVGSVNTLLPPAKDKTEEKQRNAILRSVKRAAADRDPTELQKYLATLLQSK